MDLSKTSFGIIVFTGLASLAGCVSTYSEEQNSAQLIEAIAVLLILMATATLTSITTPPVNL